MDQNVWKCEVRKAENGFIIKYDDELSEDYIKTEEEVFENIKDEYDDRTEIKWSEDRIAFTKLIYGLAEHFGIEYGKWSNDNLRVSFDKDGHGL